VGIVGIIGDAATEHPTGDAVPKFIIVFLIGWKIWGDLSLSISWFETGTLPPALFCAVADTAQMTSSSGYAYFLWSSAFSDIRQILPTPSTRRIHR
jgi:hypothetical protein